MSNSECLRNDERLVISHSPLVISIWLARAVLVALSCWILLTPDQIRAVVFGVSQTPLAFFWPGCPCCGCGCVDRCANDRASCEYELVIAGMADGSPPFGCTTCDQLNGTYILTHNGFPEDCIWNYLSGGTIGCGITGWRLILTSSGSPPGGSSGVDRLIVHRLPDTGSFGPHIGWYENVSFPYACQAIDGLSLSNYFDETGIPLCDNSGATATLTALN